MGKLIQFMRQKIYEKLKNEGIETWVSRCEFVF